MSSGKSDAELAFDIVRWVFSKTTNDISFEETLELCDKAINVVFPQRVIVVKENHADAPSD